MGNRRVELAQGALGRWRASERPFRGRATPARSDRARKQVRRSPQWCNSSTAWAWSVPGWHAAEDLPIACRWKSILAASPCHTWRRRAPECEFHGDFENQRHCMGTEHDKYIIFEVVKSRRGRTALTSTGNWTERESFPRDPFGGHTCFFGVILTSYGPCLTPLCMMHSLASVLYGV